MRGALTIGLLAMALCLAAGCVERAIVPGFGAGDGAADGGDDAMTSDDGEDAEEVGGVPDDPCFDDPDADCDGDDIPNSDDPFPDGGDPPPVSGEVLYANTPDALYVIDPVALEPALVGRFTFDGPDESITDIAIDRYRVLYAVSSTTLYVCDPETVACTSLAEVPGANGAGFVSSPTPGEDDALYLATASGEWWRIDLDGPNATADLVGTFGIGGSSGDIAASDPLTVASIDIGALTEIHVVDPLTGMPLGPLPFPDPTDAWGLAFFQTQLYAFSPSGQITVSSGVVRQTGLDWWGAATFPGSAD